MEEAARRVGRLSRLRLRGRSIRVALTAGLIMVALSGCTGGGSAQGGSSSTSGWTTHRDASFSLDIPSAWQVSSDSHTGRIDAAGSNGDRVEILPFFTRASLTPAAAIAVLQGLGSSLEPTAQWQAPTPAGASTARMSGTLAGSEAVGLLSYVVTSKGTAGDAFVAVAKSGGLRRDAATLARIVRSVQTWGPPVKTAPTTTYTTWRDRAEGAFSLQVPQGWSVVGGLTRPALTLAEWSVQATNPDKTISVFMGDPFPVYEEPNAYYSEGQAAQDNSDPNYRHPVLRYMPGTRFISDVFGPSQLPGFKLIKVQDRPEIAASYAVIPGLSRYAAGQADFTFTGQNGEQLQGGAVDITEELTPSPGFALWDVKQLTVWAGNDQTFAEAGDIMLRMSATFTIDQQWLGRQQQAELNQSKIISEVGRQISDTIAQGYWGQQAIADDISRRRENAILGTVDVTDSAGETYKVDNSSNYYWQAPDRTILGTNSGVPPCSNCKVLIIQG